MADTSTDPVEITPTLQNCSITEPAPTVENGTKHYYLSPKQTTVTLKADTGYIFKNDGKLTYQETEYASDDLVIKATNTNTASISLPADINWDNQFNFPLTMSAVKDESTTPTAPTVAPTTPKTTEPKTQLDVLKNSLRIPLDLKDDDTLLQSYIDGATEYLKSTLDEDATGTRLDSKRAKVVINALAELMYQNRGDETTSKDFPFTLRALINQLKY
ncbi:head-tail connector protein [Lactiplantibacillus plantarum]|uniref:head-tail connector protein n=1 Tax=Lactiplantibacillus plantarum TaxID=1590 RepID=UPI0021CB2312|nr:head-tail connector protein [Lactiplantibacillus plantarum]